MRIYSEKTNKEYRTVEECLSAEKAYDEEIARREAEKTKLNETRAARNEEIEKACEKAINAQNEYYSLVKKYVKDYGRYPSAFGKFFVW